MSWRDDWEAQQQAIRDAIPLGGLIEAVQGEVVNFRLTEPLRCEDCEFVGDSLRGPDDCADTSGVTLCSGVSR